MISRPTCPASRAAPWSSSTARTGRCAPACSRCRRAQQRHPASSRPAARSSNSRSATRIFDQPGKLRLGAVRQSAATPATTATRWRSRPPIPTLDINDVMASIRHVNPKYGFYVNARAAARQGRRPVRPRKLERRPERNPVLHRHRPQRLGRPVDQGQLLGTSGRHDRHRRRDQRPVRRAPRFPRRRRPRPSDRRRPAQLQHRADFRDLLRLRVNKSFTLTADYQFIANPAYNADRGPVSIFSAVCTREF